LTSDGLTKRYSTVVQSEALITYENGSER